GGAGRAVRRALVPAAEAPGEGLNPARPTRTWSQAVAGVVARPQAEGEGRLRQCPLVDTMDTKCLICRSDDADAAGPITRPGPPIRGVQRHRGADPHRRSRVDRPARRAPAGD